MLGSAASCGSALPRRLWDEQARKLDDTVSKFRRPVYTALDVYEYMSLPSHAGNTAAIIFRRLSSA
jgi:hypothetical protein